MVTSDSFSKWSPYVLSVLRMITAFLFMQHGMQKLLSFPAAPPTPPALFSLLGLAGILELVGGADDPWPLFSGQTGLQIGFP